MNVKTGELKAKLSAYLHRVREEGATYVVCDRNRPIALLTPLDQVPDNNWSRQRLALLAQARAAGIQLTIPTRSPVRPKLDPQISSPSKAAPSVEAMRHGRNW